MSKEFTPDEKCQLFDKISSLYYHQNFGSTSKTDLETLLFSEYIEHCLTMNEQIDDYTLSKQLGITQSRVRALKVRKELKYPRKNFVWQDSFADEIKNARYDEKNRLIKVTIQDVNVMTEIRHYIEENGWYYECSLNSKLLQMPLNCFCDICLDEKNAPFTFSMEAKETIKALSHKESEMTDFIKDFSKDGLKSFLMKASKELIAEVLKLLPFGGFAATAFKSLIKVIEED